MLTQLLRNKTPVSGEIELTLFEHCNMQCNFCTQDHNNMIGTTRDEILDKIKPIEMFIARDPKPSYNLNIMGGELFQDDTLEYMLPIYAEFINIIHALGTAYQKTFNVNLVTNLLFTKVELVQDFFKYQNKRVNLITSYDFSGRFTPSQLVQFKQNIELFKNNIVNVSFVATKQSIKKAMQDDDPYFVYLYDTFELYFDYFVPDKDTSNLLPSDSELLQFFKWLVDNYPQVDPIREWINQPENNMTCYSLHKVTILPNNTEVTCRYKNYQEVEFNNPIYAQSNDNLIQAFLTEYDCLSCEYFNRCGFRCFVQWDWKDRIRDLDTCLYKQLYNYIQEGV